VNAFHRIACLLCIALMPLHAQAESRIALVIGNGAYQVGR
jgi:hypothetical protein